MSSYAMEEAFSGLLLKNRLPSFWWSSEAESGDSTSVSAPSMISVYKFSSVLNRCAPTSWSQIHWHCSEISAGLSCKAWAPSSCRRSGTSTCLILSSSSVKKLASRMAGSILVSCSVDAAALAPSRPTSILSIFISSYLLTRSSQSSHMPCRSLWLLTDTPAVLALSFWRLLCFCLCLFILSSSFSTAILFCSSSMSSVTTLCFRASVSSMKSLNSSSSELCESKSSSSSSIATASLAAGSFTSSSSRSSKSALPNNLALSSSSVIPAGAGVDASPAFTRRLFFLFFFFPAISRSSSSASESESSASSSLPAESSLFSPSSSSEEARNPSMVGSASASISSSSSSSSPSPSSSDSSASSSNSAAAPPAFCLLFDLAPTSSESDESSRSSMSSSRSFAGEGAAVCSSGSSGASAVACLPSASDMLEPITPFPLSYSTLGPSARASGQTEADQGA
mmetsp:Transcript_7632/g.26269  ORF Transcript_7632/g.26269 Transcript_7632/m.26269 type:complete len:453 (-) Transcript_7632:168-1526(-)